MWGVKHFETGQNIPLEIDQCFYGITVAKAKDQDLPLVLQFWGEH